MREYVLSFAGVLAVGFLLMILMLLAAGLSAVGKCMGGALPEPLDATPVVDGHQVVVAGLGDEQEDRVGSDVDRGRPHGAGPQSGEVKLPRATRRASPVPSAFAR